MLALKLLETTFGALLWILTGAAGVFGAYLVAQLFRNPSRR